MGRVRLVAVGRVGRAHGLGGEVRVDPRGGLPRGLAGYTRFHLGRGRGEEARPVRVLAHRAHGHLLLVRFEGVETPEEARALAGATLFVERSELPPLGEGEYYHADLLGCRVLSPEGRDLGVVVDVYDTGGHDVAAVARAGREWLLPIVADWVLEMDLDRGELVARVPVEAEG